MAESLISQRVSSRVSTVQSGEREQLLAQAASIPNVLKLGRGDPDLDTPEHIVEAAVIALRNGFTHYTYWAGILELRQAISHKLASENKLHYDPDEIIVTTGVQQAMYLSFQALLNPGDEVLIGDPCYNYYEHVIAFAGGKTVLAPTYDTDFILRPEVLAAHITKKTKALVIVSPHNPTGAVIPEETLEAIAEFAKENDLIVISDEIYEKIIFEGLRHVSIASFSDMRERSIVLNGFSKAYSMTGWRVGYMAAPQDFIQQCQALKHMTTLSVNHAAQAGALTALTGDKDCIQETVATYYKRRCLVLSSLDEMGLSYAYPGGTFCIFIDIRKTGLASFDFCREFLCEKNVLMFPGTMYGNGEGFVRMSVLAPIEKLREAMEKLKEFVVPYLQNRET